jgi:hypothetical protein
MKVLMANIAPGTTEDEVKALVQKYAAAEVTSVERVAEEGPRPGAILEVVATTEMMFRLTQRLDGMYWKGRSLTVQAMMR